MTPVFLAIKTKIKDNCGTFVLNALLTQTLIQLIVLLVKALMHYSNILITQFLSINANKFLYLIVLFRMQTA